MSNLITLANRYLAPPEHAFWNWSEDGDAIVWIDGNQTIAFRGELETILKRHVSKGLPPLGSILLIVAACRDSWDKGRLQLRGEFNVAALMSEGFSHLNKIHGTPQELRSGIAVKAELTAMIFETTNRRTSPEVAQAVVDALASGLALEFIRDEQPLPTSAQQILHDLRPLRDGLERFDAEAFRLRLETGLEQLVAPAEVEEPLAVRIRKLFDRLEHDEEFAGLVRLARNLLAMVHLPRLLSQPDEMPVGGVSDISNRGTLERLLLSELAQDDDMLMTRVAMNEAMYLRRETPPRNPPRNRLLLLDTGLRMWGIPRVLATSAAMSFAAMNQGPIDLRVLRCEGHRLISANLATRSGLIEHLKVLDPFAHPGNALADLSRWREGESCETDVILVTTASVLDDREFQDRLKEVGESIGFLVTVSRDGTFQLLQQTPHGTRLLREAHLDLAQLLSPVKKPVVPLVDLKLSPDLPAILGLDPFPLRLSHNIIPRQTWTVRHYGVLAITNDRRLMNWDSPRRGARQITDRLSSRRLLWSESRASQCLTHFVVGNAFKPKLQLGIVDLASGLCVLTPLECSQTPVDTVCAHGGVLFIVHRDLIVVCDMATGERIQSMTTPKGYSWSQGRYFRKGRDWKVLSYDGLEPHFEDVPTKGMNPLVLFDLEGIQGPAGIALINSTYFLVSLADEEYTRLEGNLVPPVAIVGVSPNGERVLAKQRRPGHAKWTETVLIDIPNRTIKPITRDPCAVVDPEIWRLACPREYRNRIHAIAGHADGGFMLHVHNDIRNWFLHYDQQHHQVRLTSAAVNPNGVTHFRRFVPIPGPDGVGYRLQRAEWDDGSRAFLDSRGLLHLKSGDPKVPEFTVVLSQPNLAGWCANGDLWGEEYYTGKTPGSILKESPQTILRQFVSRLR